MRLFGKGGSLSNAMAPENNMRTSMALMGLGSVLRGRDAMPSIAAMMALDDDEKRRKELEANKLRASALLQGMGFYGGQPMAAPGTVPGTVPTMPVSQDAGDPRRAMFPTGSEAKTNVSRPAYLVAELENRGYPRHIAQGLVGNIMQESGPGINTGAVGDNGNSFGMAQWNGPRRHAYMQFAAARGKDPTDLDTQIDFLDWELNNTEVAARDAIMAAPDAATAARVASEKFWRPGIPHNDRRMAFADRLAGGRMNALSVAPNYPPGSVEVAQAGGIDPALMELLMMPDEVVPPAIKQLLISRAAPPKDDRTSVIQNFEYFKKRGYSDEEAARMARGGVNVTNNMGPQGVDYGKPGDGLVWQRDAEGNIVMDERGAPIAIPYQGGKAWREQQEAARKQEGRDASKGMYADVVLDELARAKGLILNDQEIPLLGSGTTGVWGGLASMVDSTNAGAVKNMLTTVRANVGFSRLQEMRANSPTGGALGQVSNLENRLLQATLGSLEQAQDKQVLLYNIDRLEKLYNDIVHGIPDPEAPNGRRKYTDEELGAMLGEIDPLGLFK